MAVKCVNNKNVTERIKYIYTPDSDVTRLCSEFLEITGIDVSTSIGFTTLLKFLASKLPKINNADIERMDYMFNIYTYISSNCHVLPDITTFCILVDISYETMKQWRDGELRSGTHRHTVKKWCEFCKGVCVSEAANGNVGAIYVSKAIHGLSDSAPAATYTQNNLYITAPATRDAIAAEFGALLSDNSNHKGP